MMNSTFKAMLTGAIPALMLITGCGDDDAPTPTTPPMSQPPPAPTTFTATVTNVSTPGQLDTGRAMGVVPLSPGVFAVYSGQNPAFQPGSPADEGTERIAEDGFTGPPLGSERPTLGASPNVTASGRFDAPGGMPDLPALFPGESAQFTFDAVPGDLLTIETMFVQSNDWFYGINGLALFAGNGNPVSGDVTGSVRLYDAGTEVDTAPGTGPNQKPVQGPMDVNVGPDESLPIALARERHPTFQIPANAAVIQVTLSVQP